MRLTDSFRDFEGYLGPVPTKQLQQYMIIEDTVHPIHTVTVHHFKVSDSEDPDMYAATPMLEWRESEKGQWVMKHAMETPMWHRMIEPTTYSWRYAITAKLKGADYTFYALKWGQKG